MQNNWSTIISKIMNFPIFILKLAPPINEAILPPIMHAIEACKHLMNHLFALIWKFYVSLNQLSQVCWLEICYYHLHKMFESFHYGALYKLVLFIYRIYPYAICKLLKHCCVFLD